MTCCTDFRDHLNELSFVQASVYKDSAARRRLWVAVEEDTDAAAGFLRFGGSHRQLRVFQLFTFEVARRRGIGRQLLAELARHGEERSVLSITARVAADLPANQFWRTAGFRLHRSERGGSTTQRTINIYLRELEVPSLLHEPAGPEDAHATAAETVTFRDRPRLQAERWALDLNVVLDALRGRDDGEALSLLAAVPVVVTAELIQELRRTSVGQGEDPLLRTVHRLPRLPEPPAEQVASLTTSLRTTLEFTADPASKRGITDRSDLLHLVACVYHRVQGFVTRDGGILRHAEALRRTYGLQVAAPADLVAQRPAGTVRAIVNSPSWSSAASFYPTSGRDSPRTSSNTPDSDLRGQCRPGTS